MVYFYVIYGLLLEIVVIQSIETITIRVTIQNVLTNIETQYILEIQLRVIRDSETSRIKSHYTFRPAHRPPIAHMTTGCRALSAHHSVRVRQALVAAGFVSLPIFIECRCHYRNLHSISATLQVKVCFVALLQGDRSRTSCKTEKQYQRLGLTGLLLQLGDLLHCLNARYCALSLPIFR
jgi:hypothetical protein